MLTLQGKLSLQLLSL